MIHNVLSIAHFWIFFKTSYPLSSHELTFYNHCFKVLNFNQKTHFNNINMAMDQKQQILETLRRSKTPLLALRKNPTVDGISSAMVISTLLKKMGKEPQVVASDFNHPGHSFFDDNVVVSQKISKTKPFVISIDVTKTKLDEMTYDLKDGKLNLYLTPREGSWRKEDLALPPTAYKHDLIITLECPDLSSLGQIFLAEPEFFGSVPILNIDHDPANEYYGAINAVDLSASSVSEIIYPLLNEEKTLDGRMATLLLSGIICKTKSFKSENVSPRTLRYASELISAGAERDLIVRELYQTRSVPTLRLWGRALARLKFEANLKIVWTLMSAQDFILAGASEETLPEVIHELINYASGVEVAVIIYERRAGGICVLLNSLNKKLALNLSEPWQGKGDSDETSFCLLKTDLLGAEKTVLDHLKKKLSELPK